MILICTGDASGDRLADALIPALPPSMPIRAIAGPRLRARGVEAIARAEEVAALGLVEAARAIPGVARALRSVSAALDQRPALVIGVDAPGLMSRIGARCRARKIPFVQWVAPQVWAWRAGRAAGVGRWADELLCLFPWEPMAFRPHQLPCTFVGHPFAAPRDGRPPRDAPPTVLLAPGSRPAEIERHWPALRAVARHLQAARPEIELVVAVAETVPAAALTGVRASFTADFASVRAHAAVVASGTATLELAAAGIPQVVVYAVHPLTWAVGRRLVRTPHLALPNLVARAPVVPEHLQTLDPAAIAADVLLLLGGAGAQQVAALQPALSSLAPDLAIQRVAARLLAHCGRT